MMSIQPDRELSFSPEFAARVITQADAIRRRRRAAGYGTFTVLVASVVVTAGVFLSAPERRVAPAPVVMSAGNPRIDISPRTATDPLQFLVPDAGPVAQFASTYSDRVYGRQREPGELLFARDLEQTDDL